MSTSAVAVPGMTLCLYPASRTWGWRCSAAWRRPTGPSSRVASSADGSSSSNRDAGDLRDPLQELPDGGRVLQRPRVAPDARHRGAQPGHGVVRPHLRPVAGAAVRDEAQPGQALLRRLQEVRALTVEVDGETPDLADGLGDALEQVGAVFHQPLRALGAGGLLVGEEREHEVARRARAGAGHLAQDGEQHRVHVLHVRRPATPQAPVGDLARERVDLPVRGAGGTTSRWPCSSSAPLRGAALVPRHPHHDVAAAGEPLDVLRLQPDLVEQFGDVLGGDAFARAGTVAVVRGVDADEVAAEVEDLVLRGGGALRGAGVGAHPRNRSR